MKHEDPLQATPLKVEYGTVQSHWLGLILSICLTIGAYLVVMQGWLAGLVSDIAVSVLGILQAVIQLLVFLHILKEPRPRWNLIILFFMLMVLVLIVFGSLWIMANLNYNLM